MHKAYIYLSTWVPAARRSLQRSSLVGVAVVLASCVFTRALCAPTTPRTMAFTFRLILKDENPDKAFWVISARRPCWKEPAVLWVTANSIIPRLQSFSASICCPFTCISIYVPVTSQCSRGVPSGREWLLEIIFFNGYEQNLDFNLSS